MSACRSHACTRIVYVYLYFVIFLSVPILFMYLLCTHLLSDAASNSNCIASNDWMT
jgi:hypothetical protein